MAGQNQTQNVDLFDAYFRRADLDRDGRISGPEAVAFFQGSNLPKPVLAQIWMHADQHKIGFLGRAEFYNALKLVTVAQSKRELTPDIVKAAIYGPASAKIPAPQINFAAIPVPSSNSMPGAPASQLSGTTPSQNVGLRGPQVFTNVSMGQQFFPSQHNQLGRPPRPMPPSTPSRPQQGVTSRGTPGVETIAASCPPNTIISTDLLGEEAGGPPAGAGIQFTNKGITPSMPQDGSRMAALGMTTSAQPRPQATTGLMQPPAPKPHDPTMPSSQVGTKDSNAVSGNGFASDSAFGDVFSVTLSQPNKASSVPASSASSLPVSSATVPASAGPQSTVKPSQVGSLQSAFPQQSMGSQHQQVQSAVKGNQQASVQSSPAFGSGSAGFPVGAGNSASGHSQVPWPRMTQFDVQRYTKVFVEVDRDRDGKITGEQARNLFLSWRLPREILKQVWDLSDQDNDSMLSLREFCIALYLMERYREGRPLPGTLPSSIMFDESLSPASGQSTAAWRPTSGLQQVQAMPGAQSATHGPRPRSPSQVPVHLAEEAMPPAQQKSKVPILEKHLVDQLSEEEQNSLNSKFQEATEANKKVEELEKEIVDSRQKIEFCRSKMQELILYKSRCDNRLNEITERTSADKREVESLAKKYEEKYKQSGDVASKLTIEESTFRDIQDKKMELYRAIVKMEQEGKGDSFQVNAVQIQSELEELVKSLNDRCKSYGLRAKPTTLVELPFGWQPGIQAGAADWDESWDKFEDEGFTFVKELTLDVQNVIAPPKAKSLSVQNKASSTKDGVTDVSSTNADQKSETLPNGGEKSPDNAHSEEGIARTPPDIPADSLGSPSQKFPNSPSGKNFRADGSPHATETQSEHGDAESVLSGDKKIDEPSWGAFDSHYDTDAVWDSSSAPTKEMNHNKFSESSFFDSGDLGLPPIRTDSSYKDIYQRKSPFAFADSVPSTPQADNLFQQKSTYVFDSVPSTPQADNLFQKKSTYTFDSFPSTPQADNLFQQKSTFAFDSVPSTPQADNLYQQKSAFAFDSFPSTPQADNLYQQKSAFAFDSVPSTPAYNYSNSPRRFSGASEEHAFDSFSRFDSFNTRDSGFFPQGESLTRFDSFRSTADSEYSQGFFPQQDSFARFDSIRSTADSEYSQGFFPQQDSFARFDSFRSTTRDSDSSHGLFPPRDIARFDSFRSNADDSHGFQSFDDTDPFGSSGPFKTSLESQTPRRDSGNWRAF